MSTAIPLTCQHCKRPIGNVATYIGGWPYHYECTRGPGVSLQYGSESPQDYGAKPLSMLSEADVRRIAQEEVMKALANYKPASLMTFGGKPAA